MSNTTLSQSCATFYGYYRRLKVQEAFRIPIRGEFDPVDVTDLLPIVYISERRSGDDFSIRLRGSEIETHIGPANPEANLLDLLPEGERCSHARFLNAILDVPCGGFLKRRFTREDGATLEILTLALPFCDANGDSRFIMGVDEFLSSDYGVARDKAFSTQRAAVMDATYIDLGHGTPEA